MTTLNPGLSADVESLHLDLRSAGAWPSNRIPTDVCDERSAVEEGDVGGTDQLHKEKPSIHTALHPLGPKSTHKRTSVVSSPAFTDRGSPTKWTTREKRPPHGGGQVLGATMYWRMSRASHNSSSEQQARASRASHTRRVAWPQFQGPASLCLSWHLLIFLFKTAAISSASMWRTHRRGLLRDRQRLEDAAPC